MTEVSDALVAALFDAMDPDHKDNVRVQQGGPVVVARIPASIWNRIRDEVGKLPGCPVFEDSQACARRAAATSLADMVRETAKRPVK